MKEIYRNKKSGNIFAIETDEKRKVLSKSRPLLFKGYDLALLCDDWLTGK
jgi:hypothetical protein